MNATRLLLALIFALALPFRAGAQPNEAPYVYVCNQGEATISVIDTETHAVTETVDLQALGFAANAKPHHVVVEPDGAHWYVSLIGANRVLKFNRANELVGQAEMDVPGLLALHPAKDLLFVGRSMSAVNPPSSIMLVQRSDMAVRDEIDTFFPRPHALITTPSGAYAYVASLAENQLMAVDTEALRTDLTRLGGATQTFVQFAISPDGSTMVATGQISGQALVFDLSDPANPVPTDTIAVGAQPWHPVYAPDGERVYFGNKRAHTVTVLNMATRSVERVIDGEGLAEPHGAALSPDGRYLYVSNNNRDGTYRPAQTASGDGDLPGTVTVIDTTTGTIERVIEVGVYPTGIGAAAAW